MKGEIGNIWLLAERADGFVVVPTNTCIRKDGLAVMGAGLAKEAARRYPDLPKLLATAMNRSGQEDLLFDFPEYSIVCLPTKRDWKDPADPLLIRAGCRDLASLAALAADVTFFVPQLGCGLGSLDWASVVRPIMIEELRGSENVVVVAQRR